MSQFESWNETSCIVFKDMIPVAFQMGLPIVCTMGQVVLHLVSSGNDSTTNM
jgi:hypothetical protein